MTSIIIVRTTRVSWLPSTLPFWLLLPCLLLVDPCFAWRRHAPRQLHANPTKNSWTIHNKHKHNLLLHYNDAINNLLVLRGGDDGSNGPSSSSSSSSSSKSSRISKKKKASSKSNSGGTTTKRKKRKPTSSLSNTEAAGQGKDAINKAMEKDSAQALGDAIRSRADELRSENPLLDGIDQSIYSVGWALGASDHRQRQQQRLWTTSTSTSTSTKSDNDKTSATNIMTSERPAPFAEDGGVEGSPSSVLVSYFLKSHGGAHALQCLCSILASLAGMGALLFSSHNNNNNNHKGLCLQLMRRTMMFAMVKHVAGLLGGALVAARAIPQVGLSKARIWMEQLARDPVSHYVFYTACVLLWLPTTSSSTSIVLWGEKWIPLILVGPILLREIVSTMLVISDVLVLWATSSSISSDDNEEEDGTALIHTVLATGQKAVNSIMSLLVTPQKWRTADPAVRQEILAKLTTKVSLALEMTVGGIMTLDAIARMGQFLFGTTTTVTSTAGGGGGGNNKLSFLSVVKRLICARLYLQFLWSRKRKINRLVTDIRGGSAQLPFYVLDVLMDPWAAMGLPKSQKQPPQTNGKRDMADLTWKDYVRLALGLDE